MGPLRKMGKPGLRRLAVCLLLLPVWVFADRGFYESEPNDTPADFHPIQGEISLYGTMVGLDQDGFLWTVTDNDARKRWTFTLNGEPGALTIAQIVRLEYAENGVDVTGKRTLFKMGTRDGVTPAVHENLQFEPGEYLIGLAQAGAGRGEPTPATFRPPVGSLSFGDADGQDDPAAIDGSATGTTERLPPNAEPGTYRLIISEGKKLNPQPNPKGRESRETAYTLRPRGEFSTFEAAASAWYSLTFSEKNATERWDVHVQAPVGRPLRARLVNASGEEMLQGDVDDKGKLRFPDLAPPADTNWFVELTSKDPGFIHAIASEAVGQRITGEEVEPNINASFANRVDFAQPVTGRIGGDDSADYFLFTADESTADELRTLRIETATPTRLQLCLKTPRQQPVQCRTEETPIKLPDLALDPGAWAISIDRAAAETTYTLAMISQGPVQPGFEIEPNDRIEYAKGMPDKLRIKGRFSGTDTDFYEILIAEEPQLWRFQVMGDELFELGYYDGSMQQKDKIRVAAGQRRMRMDNIFLLPGRHFLRVSGRDGGSYTLLARLLGPPDPNGELEPNDQHNRQRLTAGQTRHGLSSDKGDQDFYRFFVANWDHLRLTFTPPADGIVAPNVYWYNSIIAQGQPKVAGEPLVLQGLFPPGDYHIVLDPRQVSDAEYSLSLERLPRWSCPADCEPNGQGLIWLAAPLPADLVLEGQSGMWRDNDYYQLPAFENPTELHLHSPDSLRLSLGTSMRNREILKYDAEFGGFKTTVPAGEPHRLMIESHNQPYRVQLEFPQGELQPVIEALPVTLKVTLDESSVAAFRQHGQQVGGRLRITNPETTPVELRLEAVTGDYRWQVNLDSASLTVPPNGNVEVEFDVLVPDDAWADPVRISIRALDGSSRQAEVWQEIAMDRQRLPVNPRMHSTMPDSLRGGFNAAWLPFGALWTEETATWATRTDTIRDDLVFAGARAEGPADGDGWDDGEHPELTIDLPGDKPVPVAGTSINHFGVPGSFFNVREATLLLSLDGETFTEALHFETLPVKTEQHFALEQPVLARFARLRVISTFREQSAERLLMAEWKVIVAPGHDLSDGEGFNIADPSLGGHLVWSQPAEPYAPRNVVTPDDASNAAVLKRGDPTKAYVIAFKQNRAAQITGIDWLYADDAREAWKTFERVEVAVSLDSPIGPWQPIGELKIDPQGFNGRLKLTEPAWARFVRLTAHRQPDKSKAQEPGQILIHERPAGPDYLSVLGEWGTQGPRAFYEWQQGLPAEPELIAADNTSRARARELPLATAVGGQVALGKQTHWYRMTIPADQNTLVVTLQGDPSVRTVVELENAAGERILVRRIDQKLSPDLHGFEALVEPGSDIWFHVFEPPRNVAFTWDTSASVNRYIPTINNAIVAFSGQVVPGQETVNLFPFPTGPLLDKWLGEPYMLQTILNDYRRPSSSSAAEVTMKRTGQALGPLPGTKAIVVITDGDVNHDGGMWPEMIKVQPRIFSVQVSGAERIHQQLLRDWAMVNGGHYTQLLYDGEMDVAFDRATTLMHRPAGYTLKVTSEFRKAPGPGLLLVQEDKKAQQTGAAAVELILDASGSMLQRLDGKRRIAVAKEVLSEVVRDHIPAGTPVALRVFGHKEVDSCRTDLEIPLAPLDPDSAATKIAAINAMNLARTPIADSLKAVPADLKGTGGIVVLVTDGEETCDGDPAAVIAALKDRGFALNVNIVGFAIDDAELAAQFETWAEAGGGRYFAANDQGGLSDAIEDALKVPFTVYDQGGNEVASGQVGGAPVELEAGFYRVVAQTSPQQTFEQVDVQGESEVVLKLE